MIFARSTGEPVHNNSTGPVLKWLGTPVLNNHKLFSVQNNQQMHRGSSSILIIAFLDLPQHVSASHCHHQRIVVSSEATQAVCIVDVYGLRPVHGGQLPRDVTKHVHAWLDPSTTEHCGRAVIHKHPQYKLLE
jgi:hypothetical protein